MSHFRHICNTKISRISGHYIGTFWPSTGIAKWSTLYERFKGFPGCWSNTQWKFPRFQSTVSFPSHPIPGEMLSYSIGMPSHNDKSPDIWDTHDFPGNVLVNLSASSSAPYPLGVKFMELMHQNTHLHMWWVKVKHQLRIRDVSQDRQSENHFSLVKRFFKELWDRPTTTTDFRSSFWQSLHAYWKMRFKIEICICSQFPTEATL